MQCTLLQCASVPVTPHCRQCLMLLVLFISALDNMYILKVPKPKPPDPVPSPELHTFICYCLLSVFAWILFMHFSNSTSLAEDFIGPDHLQFSLYLLVLINSPKPNSSCFFPSDLCSCHHSDWEDCTSAVLLVLGSLLSPLHHLCASSAFIISCPGYFKFNKRGFFKQLLLDIFKMALIHFLGNLSGSWSKDLQNHNWIHLIFKAL